jgi:PAS domain S-box-containing protein
MKHRDTKGDLVRQAEDIRAGLIEYAATHTVDELLTKALDEISALVDSPIAFLHFVDADQNTLSLQQWSTSTLAHFCKAEGKGRHYPIHQAGVWADCVRERKPIIHNDYASLENKRGLPEGHAQIIRELVIPIIRNDKVVATLGVGNKSTDYTDGDVELVTRLSDAAWEVIQRRKAEEALQDSEKRYRRLFESAKDGILILDAETGLMVDANPFLTELLGYSHEELCGKFLWEIGAFKDVASSKESFEELKNNEYIRYDDLPLKTADGHIVEVEFVSNVYLVDHAKVIQCNIRDITARKRADAERERLLSAIDQADEIVLITDAEGTIDYVNPAFERVTGYTRREAIGQNPRMLKSGQQDDAFYRNMWDTLSKGGVFRGRMINRRKDGIFYTEAVTISPVRDASGRIVNFVSVNRDITEQLRLAAQLQQAQKMESIGRLAGGVAHDFNNMLSVIIGYTDLALNRIGPAEPQQRADLEEVLKAAHRSAEITRQLLAFARKQTISPKALDLNETVEGTLKMLRRLIGEDIDLVWQPKASLWRVIMDATQIDQILANLCVNARDAITGVGKLTIETDNVTFDMAYCADHDGFIPGQFVMLAVSDDGCGMDKETIRNVFEPFFTTKSVDKGTGLGLATVFGIVKQNNGFINVYSESGQGTTFKVYLPRHVGEVREKSAEKTEKIPVGRGETVLLAEDEPAILRMVKEMLKKLGYKAVVTGSPGEALQLAESNAAEISLLITDVVMPEMNGRELAERVHVFNPATPPMSSRIAACSPRKPTSCRSPSP